MLDELQGINIGEPSMWARLLTQIDVRENSTVLQIGAGTGYYTAILSQLVGTGGFWCLRRAEFGSRRSREPSG
ncbi:hypothetical protein [Paenochrobactrum pullorum]|uniref:hypothetical protein n=1 Tax=Paenochrobactrum pullorum TaxID=1324351 RepID=UPI0035BC5120